ncbi:MAG: hypothetical protein AAFP76_00040 [Bacteroidota bacterium]
MNALKIYFAIVTFSTLLGCQSIQYHKVEDRRLPELGAIGIFKEFTLQEVQQTRTIVDLSKPIRIMGSPILVSKRDFFRKKDSLAPKAKDSTLLRLKIMDSYSLVQRINEDKKLVQFLKSGNDFRIITEVTMSYPAEILEKLNKADELYLIQQKEKTLSIQLRENNKASGSLDFANGTIVDIRASEFCWGTPKGYKVVLMDLVPVGSNCSGRMYKSAEKAERKADIRF